MADSAGTLGEKMYFLITGHAQSNLISAARNSSSAYGLVSLLAHAMWVAVDCRGRMCATGMRST